MNEPTSGDLFTATSEAIVQVEIISRVPVIYTPRGRMRVNCDVNYHGKSIKNGPIHLPVKRL